MAAGPMNDSVLFQERSQAATSGIALRVVGTVGSRIVYECPRSEGAIRGAGQ
jgi:hypothetical protein